MEDELKIILNGLDGKVDKLDTHLNSINVTLAQQSIILDEHQKRSTQLEDRMVPVEQHVQNVGAIFKFFGFMSILVSLVAGILKIFRIL
jgi:hypothetical protein